MTQTEPATQTEAATQPPPFDVRGLALTLVSVKARLAALSVREQELRATALDWMSRNAVERLRAYDPAGTDLGTVSLAGGGPRAEVADEAKLLAWVQEHHPDEVVVARSVRESFLRLLGDKVLSGADVPGLRIVQHDPYITTSPNQAAKALAAEAVVPPAALTSDG